MKSDQNKGTYIRYIPHFDYPGLYQGITFRLADSLPGYVAAELQEQAELDRNTRMRAKMETLLNNGYGACHLRDAHVAEIVQQCLLYSDGEDYELIAWVIMPNHVHVLIRIFEGHPMDEVVQAWKSVSAHRINKALGRSGQLWDRGYFDRYIRDEKHFWNAVHYIHDNPVKAGLVDAAQAWKFSSVNRFAEE